MTIDVLDQVAALVQRERQALLSRRRQSNSDQTIPEALSEGSPPAHGLQRLQDAFDIEEVVAEYNILRGCIHDLADDNGFSLQGRPFHIVNVIYADAGLLRRIFQNLIANAIKYTPRGEVVIGAQVVEAEEAVECWVVGNGAGIPETFLEHVFDRGESDPNGEGGTGVGLAIVKTFTAAHGGTVTVQSRQGGGSTFRISLPTKTNAGGRTPRSN